VGQPNELEPNRRITKSPNRLAARLGRIAEARGAAAPRFGVILPTLARFLAAHGLVVAMHQHSVLLLPHDDVALQVGDALLVLTIGAFDNVCSVLMLMILIQKP
jgi:hypothetical protein